MKTTRVDSTFSEGGMKVGQKLILQEHHVAVIRWPGDGAPVHRALRARVESDAYAEQSLARLESYEPGRGWGEVVSLLPTEVPNRLASKYRSDKAEAEEAMYGVVETLLARAELVLEPQALEAAKRPRKPARKSASPGL